MRRSVIATGTRIAFLGLFLVGLLVGALATYVLVIVSTPKSASAPCEALTSFDRSSYVVAGSINYPPELWDSLAGSLNKSPVSNWQDFFGSLLSSVYFGNSSYSSFNFQFSKNSHFNNEMYGGDYNSSLWTYPTQMRIGTQNGLLIFFVQILYLYGSPYGNSSSRGNNQLTLFMRVGNRSYGFDQFSNLGPGTFYQNFGYISSAEGWYTYGSASGFAPNQTYYVGSVSWDHPYGTGPEVAVVTYNNTGFYYSGSIILGTLNRPIMTRYFYAINMSKLPIIAGSTCTKLSIMWNLFTSHPFGIPSNQTQTGVDFLSLNDNYPTHNIAAPFHYSDYLTLYLSHHESTS